jgi:2-phosphosulfolactate phosphatase
MRIEVILTPAELPALAKRDLSETVCVVFDILRATSTFVTALHRGAEAIIPVSEISEALEIKKQQPELLTGGERNGVKIQAEGTEFDSGNSPREFAPEKTKGKTIVSTTTNGTRALRACTGAKMVLAGSFLNMNATAKFLHEKKFKHVLLVCAGTRENTALEDVLAAGAFCEALLQLTTMVALSDSAQIALATFQSAKRDLPGTVRKSENALRLLAIPELRDDVNFCLQRDIFDFVAVMKGDAIRILKATI